MHGPLNVKSMEQSPSQEANRCSAGHEIPHNLWNPYVYYRLHWDAPRSYPDPEKFSPYIPSHFLEISFNIILPFAHCLDQWFLAVQFFRPYLVAQVLCFTLN
jgi:hypothetical protein